MYLLEMIYVNYSNNITYSSMTVACVSDTYHIV